MPQLIVFSGSPKEAKDLLNLVEKIAQAGEKTILLLVQEACEFAATKPFCEDTQRHGVNLCVLKEDFEARGLLEQVVKSVEIVDYEGWIRLLEECEKVFSWI